MGEKISSSIPRLDAEKKISGKAEYLADLRMDNLIHARTVRSSKAHARIEAIHLPELPEGYVVVGKEDITGNNRMQTVVSDHPIFAEGEVNYIGQPILLITGPSKEKTAELASQVKIEYRELSPITTIEEAVEKKEHHVVYDYSKGDPEKAFANASKIITDEFHTGRPEHLYLETNGVVAKYHNEKITIYGSIQCPYFVKNAIIEATGFPKEKIQIIQTVTGGAFGGKEEYPSLLAAQAATAAIKTNKTVRLILDRKEDIEASTKRHPSILKYRVALNEENEINALNIDVSFDGGAYATISPVVLQRGIFTATGVYAFPNLQVRGRVAKTNTVPSGAFRGFGSPQVLFGIEQLMNRIAYETGKSSLELKKHYFLKKGDTTSTGGKMWSDVKIREVLEKINRMSGYEQKKPNPGKNKGMGISFFLHGCGFTGKGEVNINAEVYLKKKGSKVGIYTSNVEMGQGASTTLIKIVAYSLSIPEDDVEFVTQDTDKVPDSGPTAASRTAMIIGGLVKKACNRLKEKWNEEETEVKEVYKHPEYVSWDNDKFQGDAYPVYSWGANVAEVEADPVTCELKVEKLWGVFDIGVALDEDIIRGQMQGGLVQGLGFAYMEKLTNKNGKLDQLNLTDYTIPTSMDIPEIECDFVENPYEFGPYGAKCAGELPLSGVAPALAEAAGQALNITVHQVPMTPEYLKAKKNEH